jgi:predicted dehydrogenase
MDGGMQLMNLALIGYGYWGQKVIKYLPRLFDVKWTCTSKTDLGQVWPDIEAVMIATPIDTHFDLALQAIHKGKHVFVEKPLAMNTANAVLLKAEAERMGVKLAVDYTQTFSKGIQKAVELVKESGGPRFIEMSTKNLGRFKPYSVYWLLASHWLSVLDMVVPLKNFSASGFEQKPVETA